MKYVGFEKVSVALISLVLSLSLGSARAEEGYTEAQSGSLGIAKRADLEKLKKLREEDPARFKQVIQNRKEELKERLTYLKGNNPEKFQALMKQRRVNQEKVGGLRRTDPEKFKEIVQKRKANRARHLQYLKNTDSEKYR